MCFLLIVKNTVVSAVIGLVEIISVRGWKGQQYIYFRVSRSLIPYLALSVTLTKVLLGRRWLLCWGVNSGLKRRGSQPGSTSENVPFSENCW